MEPWHSAAVTHIGRRTTNEDGLLEAPDLRLWAVADGMGGHAHGEVASRTGLQALKRAVLGGHDLAAAVAAASRAVWEAARKAGSDMGTTLVALRLHPDSFQLAWLGDSRAYRWDGRDLAQLTTDHTMVQDWVEQGRITAGEARHHPYGHILTRAAGLAPEETAASVTGPLRGDERFLLCSDGLTDTLGDEAMAAILAGAHPGEAPQRLLEAATAADNPYQDNLTAVVVYPA
ncbi:MAG TPA: protein phosphatase 2C domain-containing protein [Gammaproteobacteria bacterium]|nr:protein phosphatase 2C domain-containing protein [Gammaproteobacteria bacterium]